MARAIPSKRTEAAGDCAGKERRNARNERNERKQGREREREEGVGEGRETQAVASRLGRPGILHCVFFRDK